MHPAMMTFFVDRVTIFLDEDGGGGSTSASNNGTSLPFSIDATDVLVAATDDIASPPRRVKAGERAIKGDGVNSNSCVLPSGFLLDVKEEGAVAAGWSCAAARDAAMHKSEE